MEDFEKLGAFYLGREYDLSTKETGGLLLYDSKDLVTHGVCVGMTGSGKTGLCIGLLEEAALDGIPAIVIDPKGDLADLLLTFPDLRPEDFRPWVNQEEAAKKGLSPDDFAKQQAETWKKGLADWGEDPARIAAPEGGGRLHHLHARLQRRPAGEHPQVVRRARRRPCGPTRRRCATASSTAVTSLLGLLGVAADPIQSREHILLSSLFNAAWSAGQDLDLASLIQQIQKPPFAKVGVLDLESFYPAKDRFELAMLLNNLLAAPGFQTWLEGEPLDIGRMLFTAEGKARVSIFSIAHLSDAERMFFVSLLLNEVLGWVRAQPGTGSLRAIVYMDEIFGFFPPVAEPPSKRPLLTLLKQARAFGVGILLATQNPVDLDYKGLANAGTWFIGRLQTERDKDRLLEGLEGVAAGTEAGFDRQKMEETLAGLGKRVFLMYNVHEDAPVTFQTRWTMSYLAGPLTRAQIKTLMDPRRPAAAAAPQPAPAPAAAAARRLRAAAPRWRPRPLPAAAATAAAAAGRRRTCPPRSRSSTCRCAAPLPPGPDLVYRPGVLAAATVNFVSSGSGVSTSTKIRRIAQAPESALAVDWDAAHASGAAPRGPRPAALRRGHASPRCPPAMTKVASYRSWGVGLLRLGLPHPDRGGVQERRLQDDLQPGRDRRRVPRPAAARRPGSRGTRPATSCARSTRPRWRPSSSRRCAPSRRWTARPSRPRAARCRRPSPSAPPSWAPSWGARALSTGTLGRATTTMRDVGRSMDEAGDVKRAEETLDSVKQKRADLEAEFQAELDALEGRDRPGDRDAGEGAHAAAQERHHRGFPGAGVDALLAGRDRRADGRLGIGRKRRPTNEKGEARMLKEFKAFIDRGNLLQMAVAFIMGVAFAAVVTSLVNDIIMPAVGLALGGLDFTSLFAVIKEGDPAGPVQHGRPGQGGRRRHHQLRHLHQRDHRVHHRGPGPVLHRQGLHEDAEARRRRSPRQGLPVLRHEHPDGGPPLPELHVGAACRERLTRLFARPAGGAVRE